MGMIDRFIGLGANATALGNAAAGMAEVFTRNQTRKMELEEAAYSQAVSQFGQEFAVQQSGVFNSLVNGLNRLPRPLLALGTMGLFVYAMIEPTGFGLRMQGLQQVPEPLWWLLGAIVGFYFGAREAHYFRHRNWSVPENGAMAKSASATPQMLQGWVAPKEDFADNAALRDWAASLRG
ncbi:holin family protein [Paracoccus sp. Z330]|uniref:Holin family protein n=1 Tax=Paracoccus onchidii TaxID=3017813 RepID=A0ABT4ZDA2_9RHOB|nr:holin family protein [Paracoccus onchidii]MDB6176948.1 holin family protein [Paracoccus onchidii]